MHRFINNICKLGMLICFPVLMLSACTGREDIVLELADSGAEQEIDIDETPEIGTEIIAADITQTKIYVHICGAVVNPGVYELDEGGRVFEGIEAAGGFREDACQDYVNQAGRLSDGERLVIPTIEEVETARADGTYQDLWRLGTSAGDDTSGAEVLGSGTSGTSTDLTGLVNINTATESELSAISGIGDGKAAAIVKYRQENGGFTSIEDIMKVSGIKEGTYEKIKDKITVN